jgi:hypothetical protein
LNSNIKTDTFSQKKLTISWILCCCYCCCKGSNNRTSKTVEGKSWTVVVTSSLINPFTVSAVVDVVVGLNCWHIFSSQILFSSSNICCEEMQVQFYQYSMQLLRQQSCASKVQTYNVSTKKLRAKLTYVKAAHRTLVKLTRGGLNNLQDRRDWKKRTCVDFARRDKKNL